MKKFLSLSLAVVLMFTMSTVAFASKVVDIGALGGDLFLYNTAEEQMETISIGGEAVPSGSTLYIPVITKMDTNDGVRSVRATTVSDLSNYKLKTTVTEGKGVLGGVRFTIKNDYDGKNAAHIAISTLANTTKEPISVSFTLAVTPKDGATVEEIDTANEYDFTFTVAPQGKANTPSAPADTTTAPAKDTTTVAEDAIVVAGEQAPANPALVPSQTAPVATANPQVNPNTGAPSFAALTVLLAVVGVSALTLRK